MPQRTTTPQVPTGTIRMRIIGGWHRLDDMCQMRVLLLLTTVMICNATRCHEHLCSRSSRRRRTTRSRAAGSIGNPSRRPRLVPQLLTFLGQERPKTDRPHVTSGRAAPAVPVTRSRAPRPPPPRRPGDRPPPPPRANAACASARSRRVACAAWVGVGGCITCGWIASIMVVLGARDDVARAARAAGRLRLRVGGVVDRSVVLARSGEPSRVGGS